MSFTDLIDLQVQGIFFRSCRYNSGSISEIIIGFEHIFEIVIFKRIKFCLWGKNFKNFSNEYLFVQFV